MVAGQVGASCSNETGEVGALPATPCHAQIFKLISWHWVETAPLCLGAHLFSHKKLHHSFVFLIQALTWRSWWQPGNLSP